MPHKKIKNIFLSAVNSVIDNPELFAVNPAKDFSRQRKITSDTLISFLVSKGSSSRVEMLDFWRLNQKMPSLPTLNQQRAKLKPEELEAVLAGLNSSASGVHSIHINAFFDLDAHIYTDAVLQPVHEKNEFGAFCDIMNRHETLPSRKNVYIGDRGYCSYNNMAHVVEQE